MEESNHFESLRLKLAKWLSGTRLKALTVYDDGTKLHGTPKCGGDEVNKSLSIDEVFNYPSKFCAECVSLVRFDLKNLDGWAAYVDYLLGVEKLLDSGVSTHGSLFTLGVAAVMLDKEHKLLEPNQAFRSLHSRVKEALKAENFSEALLESIHWELFKEALKTPPSLEGAQNETSKASFLTWRETHYKELRSSDEWVLAHVGFSSKAPGGAFSLGDTFRRLYSLDEDKSTESFLAFYPAVLGPWVYSYCSTFSSVKTSVELSPALLETTEKLYYESRKNGGVYFEIAEALKTAQSLI